MHVFFLVVAIIHHRSGSVNEHTGRLGFHEHIGEHELHGLVLRDGFSESLTLPGVVRCVIETSLRQTHAARADGGPRLVEAEHGGLEAPALFADHVLKGYARIFEKHFARRDAAHPHLSLAPSHPEFSPGNDEERDASRAFVGFGLRRHGDEIRDARTRAIAFLAVDEP